MRWLVALLLAGCAGHVEPVQRDELDSCGALPDLTECHEAANLTEDFGCPTLVCDGWADCPDYNRPDEYAQFISLCDDGIHRTVMHVHSRFSACGDSQ